MASVFAVSTSPVNPFKVDDPSEQRSTSLAMFCAKPKPVRFAAVKVEPLDEEVDAPGSALQKSIQHNLNVLQHRHALVDACGRHYFAWEKDDVCGGKTSDSTDAGIVTEIGNCFTVVCDMTLKARSDYLRAYRGRRLEMAEVNNHALLFRRNRLAGERAKVENEKPSAIVSIKEVLELNSIGTRALLRVEVVKLNTAGWFNRRVYL